MMCRRYGFKITNILKHSYYCLNCPDWNDCHGSPHFELENVDIFELAKLLKEKQEAKEELDGKTTS